MQLNATIIALVWLVSSEQTHVQRHALSTKWVTSSVNALVTWRVQSQGRRYPPWCLARSSGTGTTLTPQPVNIVRKREQICKQVIWEKMRMKETNLTLLRDISPGSPGFQEESIAIVKEVHPWSGFRIRDQDSGFTIVEKCIHSKSGCPGSPEVLS